MRRLSICLLVLPLALACSQDPLGGPCAEREDDVYKVMAPKDGDNFISQDPTKFLNCESFICLSSNGSKPYCTKKCGSDAECANGNGIKMECKVVTEFGALACRAPSNEHCETQACLDRCPTVCADSECQEDCEQSCNDELCCEREPSTGGVLEPATYCAALDGQVPHDPKAEPIGG